jgi:endonuclease/exonuclease/phosphatase family metal-dependent hydrolase
VPGKTAPVRFLHWNVHSWQDPRKGTSNVAAVIELVHQTDPDVVSLVEVDETWGEPARLWQAADATGRVPVFSPVFEYGTDAPAGGFGNAILTRLPVLAVQQRQLTWPDTVYAGHEPSEPRALVLVRVATTAGPIWVGSTHLPSGDADQRAAALRQLRRVVDALDGPGVVCGDFNASPDRWPADAPAPQTGRTRLRPTAPAGEPARAVDYAVAAPGLELTTDVLTVPGSDHLPVLVDVHLP